jgi:hypothetical protein
LNGSDLSIALGCHVNRGGWETLQLAIRISFLIAICAASALAQQSELRKWAPDLVLQHHLHGYIYCPGGEVSKAEVEIRSPLRWFPRDTVKVGTDKQGYFDFGAVSPGRYELVVKNYCSGSVLPIQTFDVVVDRQPVMFRDCLLEEIVVQLNDRAKAVVLHRPTRNAACG